MKHTLTLIFSLICFLNIAQETLEGIILTKEGDQDIPLTGASIFWLGTKVGTTSDQNGQFNLIFQKSINQLVISFIGFKSDTIEIKNKNRITHFLISSEYSESASIFPISDNSFNVSLLTISSTSFFLFVNCLIIMTPITITMMI